MVWSNIIGKGMVVHNNFNIKKKYKISGRTSKLTYISSLILEERGFTRLKKSQALGKDPSLRGLGLGKYDWEMHDSGWNKKSGFLHAQDNCGPIDQSQDQIWKAQILTHL